MPSPTIGSLFSGVAGLDRAVESVFNGRTIWHCESDPAASTVLAHRYPDTPNLGDITKVDWSAVESPELLIGGFPCQSISCAGRRAGMGLSEDGELSRSGLWIYFAKAIYELNPVLVVIENVRGLLSAKANRDMEPDDGTVGASLRAAGAVLGDLADIGYDAHWVTVPASRAGAPHKRERVFVFAYPQRLGWKEVGRVARGIASDATHQRCQECGQPDRVGASLPRAGCDELPLVAGCAAADTDRLGRGGGRGIAECGHGGEADADQFPALRGQTERFVQSTGEEPAAPDPALAERGVAQPEHLGETRGSTPEPGECSGEGADGGGTAPDSALGIREDQSHSGDPRRQPLGPVIGTGDRDSEQHLAAGVPDLGGTAEQLATPESAPHSPCDGRHEGRPESARLVGGSDAAVSGAGLVELLPTPRSLDATGIRGRTENRGDAANYRAGLTLTDVTEHLLPTPNAQDGNGGGRYNSEGHQSTLPGTVRELLPTPMTVNRTSQKAQTGRPTSGPQRGGPSYGLEDVVTTELLPTPMAHDAKGTDPSASDRHTPELAKIDHYFPTPQARDWKGGQSNQPDINDAVAALLPSPTASDRFGPGRSPGREGGDNLRTTACRDLADENLLRTPSLSDTKTPDRSGKRAEAGHQVNLADQIEEKFGRDAQAVSWGKYGPAIRQWEAILGQSAPSPTEPNKNGNPRLSARFSEFMMGWPAGWVTDLISSLPARTRPAGTISRNDALRLIGNGVVSRQAEMAIRMLLDISESTDVS